MAPGHVNIAEQSDRALYRRLTSSYIFLGFWSRRERLFHAAPDDLLCWVPAPVLESCSNIVEASWARINSETLNKVLINL